MVFPEGFDFDDQNDVALFLRLRQRRYHRRLGQFAVRYCHAVGITDTKRHFRGISSAYQTAADRSPTDIRAIALRIKSHIDELAQSS